MWNTLPWNWIQATQIPKYGNDKYLTQYNDMYHEHSITTVSII